jgi:type IV secretory pathway VirD2 relaxase
MSNDRFELKIGKPRQSRSRLNRRLYKRVVREVAKSTRSQSRRAALTRRPVAELGRGKGSLHALMPAKPGWRHVVVKARIARHGTTDLGAARAHQHYLVRDGVTPDGKPGQLYDRARDDIDGGDFLGRQKGDTYQFRLIVSADDSPGMPDLKPFVRDLMVRMEHDLHTRLDWVAVDHFNTGHPHTHIIIRGGDDQGQDLVMARHYISHGIRNRARELITIELGPELDIERIDRLRRDMMAERFTQLDRQIIDRAEGGILTVSAAPEPDRGRATYRNGRLKVLARMGLAEEMRNGVWSIAPDLEQTLRRMGERGDKMKTMYRVMREAGLERPAGDYAIFDGAARKAPVTGRIVGVGLADELSGRSYLVVDGLDGRIHYAETGKLPPGQLPEPGMLVALTGGGGKGKMRNAQIEVLSYWELDRLPHADAVTWLDKTIVAGHEPVIRDTGVGREVKAALAARQEWLVGQDLATRMNNGTITPRPGLIDTLTSRELKDLERRITAETGVPAYREADVSMVKGRLLKTINQPSMQLAAIRTRDEILIVPWGATLDRMHGWEMTGRDLAIAMTRGRGLGLSR